MNHFAFLREDFKSHCVANVLTNPNKSSQGFSRIGWELSIIPGVVDRLPESELEKDRDVWCVPE